MNVVLVAAEAAGLQALKLLAASEHRVVAVLTSTEDEARGVTVAAQARRLGVHVWPARLVTDPAFAERIADAEVDLVLNIHSLLVIDGRVLGAPRIGSFNLHPGPLPQYAGLSVPSWAIYHGERRHGVTLHWMEPEVDAGAVVSEASFAIGPCDTGLTVSAACVRHGLPLVAGLLEVAARDPSAIPATEQDLSRRRWFGRRGPHGGRVPWTLSGRDWLTSSARRTTRPGPLLGATPGLGLGDLEVAVVRAAGTGEPAGAPPGTVGPPVEHGARVATGDEWVVLERVLVEGKAVHSGEVLVPGERLEGAGDAPLSDSATPG